MASSHPYNQIVLFGDSITQFSFDPSINGFGANLANVYARKLDVINRGFSGYNTDWALPILRQLLPTVQQQKEQACSISLMTIFFGANDASLTSNPQHVPIDRYESNVKAMIDMVRNPDSPFYNPRLRIILITPPPLNEVQWNKRCEEQGGKLNRTNELAHRYSNCIKEVGKELDIAVADLWSEITDKSIKESKDLSNFFLDGLHLNGNGYQALYDLIIRIITEKFPEIHPDTVQYEIPYWRDILASGEDPIDLLQFPLLKNRPTDN